MRYDLTKHAECRSQQRGFRQRDIDLVLEYGTHAQDGILLSEQNVNHAIRQRKKEIQALERLAGAFLPVEGNTIITIQWARRKKQRRVLRDPIC